MPNVNESAARSWPGLTTFGTIDARVTRSTAELPAAAPASTYRTHTGGRPANAATASPDATATSATWHASRTLRRSKRSASAPAKSDAVTSGTSSASPSKPVKAGDRVIT